MLANLMPKNHLSPAVSNFIILLDIFFYENKIIFSCLQKAKIGYFSTKFGQNTSTFFSVFSAKLPTTIPGRKNYQKK